MQKLILSLLLVSFFGLQGCANMAVSGAQVVYNRHGILKNINDHYLTMQIFQAIKRRREEFKNAHIVIATSNGVVLLTGQVTDESQRKKAEEIAKKVAGQNEVYNLIKIASPSSTLTRLSDAWLTTKIKAKLVTSADVDATRIKVLSENGTVYLMGIVEPDEAQVATQLASETEGVNNVVKIFSYMHITKKM